MVQLGCSQKLRLVECECSVAATRTNLFLIIIDIIGAKGTKRSKLDLSLVAFGRNHGTPLHYIA